jgi:hypothetical protein
MAANPGNLQIQIPPRMQVNPPNPAIPIEVQFQGETLPELLLYIDRSRRGGYEFTGDYMLKGVRRQADDGVHDVVREQIANEYEVPRGALILLNNFDVNRAIYVMRGPALKKKDAMDIDGGRRRKTRKRKSVRKTRRYRYAKAKSRSF